MTGKDIRTMPTAHERPLGFGRRLRYRIEYLLLRGVLRYVARATPERVVRLAERFSVLGFHLLGSRRRIAIDNLLKTGMAADQAEAETLARACFRHFAVLVVESLKSDSLFRDDGWRRHVTLSMPSGLEEELRDSGKGIILAAGHFGNWEVAAQVFSLLKPVAGITSRVSNPYVDELLQELKPRNRFHLVPKQDGNSQRFVSALKEGDALAIMIDQHGGRRGMRVDFLGLPASSHTAIALLHLVTGAPIYFGSCRRTGLMQYALEAEGPLTYARTGKKQEDIRRILDDLNARLEKRIRANPEQYMWAHHRWHEDD